MKALIENSGRSLPLPLSSTHGQGCLKLSAERADSDFFAKLIIPYRTGGLGIRRVYEYY